MTNLMNDVARVLGNRGYEVEQRAINKNGREIAGLVIGKSGVNSGLHPVIYEDKVREIANGKSIAEICDAIIHICFDNSVDAEADEILRALSTFDGVKGRLILTAQSVSSDDVVKRTIGDIDLVARVNFGDSTAKVTRELANNWNVTDEEILAAAEQGTIESLKIGNILEMMMGDMGLPLAFPLVVTNKRNTLGAGAGFISGVLDGVLEKMGVSKLAIIPSSIHECLVFEADLMSVEDLKKMIKEVNATEVLPEDVLSDTPYIYENGVIRVA